MKTRLSLQLRSGLTRRTRIAVIVRWLPCSR